MKKSMEISLKLKKNLRLELPYDPTTPLCYLKILALLSNQANTNLAIKV